MGHAGQEQVLPVVHAQLVQRALPALPAHAGQDEAAGAVPQRHVLGHRRRLRQDRAQRGGQGTLQVRPERGFGFM